MKFFPSLSKEELDELSRKSIAHAEAEYKQFKEKFDKNICYLCNEKITFFDPRKLCIHWLLNPKGFDKRFFPLVYNHYDFHSILPYLRWIANTESPFKNINDLEEEKNSDKIVELTIRYKNIEWSFSSSKGDFQGIPDSKAGSTPHYHFQMRIENKSFIDYSDFHIPFTQFDLWVFNAQKGVFDDVKYSDYFGIGMQGALNEIDPDQLLEGMRVNTDETKATFHLQTMVTAKKGTLISGEKIYELIKESQNTGKTMAQLYRNLDNVNIATVIMPGSGVPNIASRKGGRNKKRK